MTVEQLLKDTQRLIDRGTINPSAKVSIQGEAKIYIDGLSLIDRIAYFESNNLKIAINKSHYNKLILISELDV